MGFFSRDSEAIGAVRDDDVPFRTPKRASSNTRNVRKPGSSDNKLDGAPLDPAETAKTRARRRLIGAVALGLAAVVFVPMLFDRTPVATADDIAIQIPDRDTPFEGRRGVPDARGPLKAASDLPTANGAPSAPTVATSGAPSSEGSPAAPSVKSEPAASEESPAPPASSPSSDEVGVGSHAADKRLPTATGAVREAPATVAEKAPEKSPERPVDKAKANGAPTDDPKALAALEGKGAPAAMAAPAAEAGGARSFAVQIAAFSVADKAHALRERLVANGLKSYTESVSTSQGVRTRVRLGPFPSHEAADRARQKLKTMKLDGSVVPL